MANEKLISSLSTIERALGMIEGVSCGLDKAYAETLPNTRQKLIKLLQCSPTDIMGNHGVGALADHILASDFINELQNEAYDLGVDSILHERFGLTWEDAAGLRKEIKRLQDAVRWIPVTERLPEKDDKAVAVVKEDGYNRIAFVFYSDSRWWDCFYDGFRNINVTHWMPLPEAPEGE